MFKKIGKILRELVPKGRSLASMGYPTIEQLQAQGIDPKDFYLFIRFGIPLPPRGQVASV